MSLTSRSLHTWQRVCFLDCKFYAVQPWTGSNGRGTSFISKNTHGFECNDEVTYKGFHLSLMDNQLLQASCGTDRSSALPSFWSHRAFCRFPLWLLFYRCEYLDVHPTMQRGFNGNNYTDRNHNARSLLSDLAPRMAACH